jgi:DNA-binding transcriptional MerR regulator
MVQDKKYYAISEVAELLGLKQHALRYADNLLGRRLTVIRGRRYYTKSDIDIIRNSISKTADSSIHTSNIDNLIYKLSMLKAKLVA